jgi:hypothetical protein
MSQEPQAQYVAPQTSGMAITSMVLGIFSFFCSIFTALPAIILGIVALGKIDRSQGRLTGKGLAVAGIAMGSVFTLLSVMMALLLIPAVSAARVTAQRIESTNNMKQIMLGHLNYESMKKTFSPAGGGGGPGAGLSWRVHILPYMEEGGADLYQQFHLDEPWDSEHNRALVARMPNIYKDPQGRLAPGKTAYLAVRGEGTAFGDGTKGPRLREFTDGLSRTAVLVEASPDQAIEWTKPADWNYDPNNPTRGLGGMWPNGILIGMGDGSVMFLEQNTPPELIKAMMTRAGGENAGP